MDGVTQRSDSDLNQTISIKCLRSGKSAPMAKIARFPRGDRVLLSTLRPSEDGAI